MIATRIKRAQCEYLTTCRKKCKRPRVKGQTYCAYHAPHDVTCECGAVLRVEAGDPPWQEHEVLREHRWTHEYRDGGSWEDAREGEALMQATPRELAGLLREVEAGLVVPGMFDVHPRVLGRICVLLETGAW